MIDRCRKFLRLSRSGRKLFVQALFLLPVTALALRLLNFKSVRSALASLAPFDDTLGQEAVKGWRQISITARMVSAAARYGLCHANCLQQALVLWWLLRRQGIESDLRIGVRKTADCFEAHAWVERLGFVLNENEGVYQRFAAFDHPIVAAGGRIE